MTSIPGAIHHADRHEETAAAELSAWALGRKTRWKEAALAAPLDGRAAREREVKERVVVVQGS